MKTCNVLKINGDESNFSIQEFIQFLPKSISLETDKENSFLNFLIGDKFYFLSNLGILVVWGKLDDEIKKVLSHFKVEEFPEEFSFNIGETFSVKNDLIIYCKDDYSSLISSSFAISQSFKLSKMTDRIQNRLDEVIVFPKSLAINGEINLSKKQLATIRGKLFLDWSEANLSFELLDTPNYFWENPEHNEIYQKMRSYLEIEQRLEVLNKKVDVVNQILTMLSEEQKHRDSSLLEIIIIALIFIEIIMLFYFEYFK